MNCAPVPLGTDDTDPMYSSWTNGSLFQELNVGNRWMNMGTEPQVKSVRPVSSMKTASSGVVDENFAFYDEDWEERPMTLLNELALSSDESEADEASLNKLTFSKSEETTIDPEARENEDPNKEGKFSNRHVDPPGEMKTQASDASVDHSETGSSTAGSTVEEQMEKLKNSLWEAHGRNKHLSKHILSLDIQSDENKKLQKAYEKDISDERSKNNQMSIQVEMLEEKVRLLEANKNKLQEGVDPDEATKACESLHTENRSLHHNIFVDMLTEASTALAALHKQNEEFLKKIEMLDVENEKIRARNTALEVLMVETQKDNDRLLQAMTTMEAEKK